MLHFVHPTRRGDGVPRGALHAAGDGRWRLGGEVDLTTAEALEVALSALPVGQELHLDLAELAFIDVRGTRTLVAAAARLAPEHRLVLHDPPAGLQRILEVCWPDAAGLEVVAA